MSSQILLTTSTGRDAEELLVEIEKNLFPTTEDLLQSVEEQKSRVLLRTQSGVDVDEKPFAPYSENGPYYHYEYKAFGGNRFSDAQKKNAAKYQKKTLGGDLTGTGLRFDSYGDMKRQLGRGVVDLFGVGPGKRMLRNVVARIKGALEVGLGIFDPEIGPRANGHNTGVPGRLPQRRWLGTNQRDLVEIGRFLNEAVLRRFNG